MPVEKSIGVPPRQIVFLVISLVVGIGSMVYVFNQIGEGSDIAAQQQQLGSSAFPLGPGDAMADEIAETGPFFLSDLSGHDRDIYLQHEGDDPATGWTAFGVRQIDAARECYIEWNQDSETFVDNCDGTVYGPDGEGLPSYAVNIDSNGNLSVDLG